MKHQFRIPLSRVLEKVKRRILNKLRLLGTEPIKNEIIQSNYFLKDLMSQKNPPKLRTRGIDASTKIDDCALQIIPFERFGNNVSQINKAIFFAKRLKIKKIYIFSTDLLKFKSKFLADGIMIESECRAYEQPAIVSDFYEGLDFPPDAAWLESSKNFVYPLLVAKPLSILDESILAVHIRSGDIFSKNPNPAYAPPPLSYYKISILDHVKKYDNPVIYFVYENMNNPSIEKLFKFCESISVKYVKQSSSLKEDLRLLLSSQHIVLSIGTFGYVLTSLHQNLQTVYTYTKWLPPTNALVNNIYSHGGAYDESIIPWKNTKEQTDYMLNFPMEELGMRSINKEGII